jgi:hypothetical protein
LLLEISVPTDLVELLFAAWPLIENQSTSTHSTQVCWCMRKNPASRRPAQANSLSIYGPTNATGSEIMEWWWSIIWCGVQKKRPGRQTTRQIRFKSYIYRWLDCTKCFAPVGNGLGLGWIPFISRCLASCKAADSASSSPIVLRYILSLRRSFVRAR